MLTIEEITKKLREYKQFCEKGAIREWEVCTVTNDSGGFKHTVDIKLGSDIVFGTGFLYGVMHDLGASVFSLIVENHQLHIRYIIEE